MAHPCTIFDPHCPQCAEEEARRAAHERVRDAAPALLEALQTALPHLSASRNYSRNAWLIYEQARVAIALATGEQK